jgi:hypothetical protein
VDQHLPPRAGNPVPYRIYDPTRTPFQGLTNSGEKSFSREEWRTRVLPRTVKANWNSPDQLYGIVVGALRDGVQNDVPEAAEHLYRFDEVPSRGACLYGIVLTKNNQRNEAERILNSCIARNGQEGYSDQSGQSLFGTKRDAASGNNSVARTSSRSEPRIAELRLIRSNDRACIAAVQHPCYSRSRKKAFTNS